MQNKTKWILGICIVAAFVATVTTVVLLKMRKKKKQQLELAEGSIDDGALDFWAEEDETDNEEDVVAI